MIIKQLPWCGYAVTRVVTGSMANPQAFIALYTTDKGLESPDGNVSHDSKLDLKEMFEQISFAETNIRANIFGYII